MHLPPTRCYLVAPRLIAGAYPGAKDPAIARRQVIQHLDAGITFFLDLTEAHELKPYAPLATELAELRGRSIEHRRMPIRDVNVPSTPAQMVAILDTLDTALAAEHTVYVHCWGGVGRTGTVVGCWLVRHGFTGEQALATIAAHWAGLTVAQRGDHGRSPETDAQHAYVRTWVEPTRQTL